MPSIDFKNGFDNDSVLSRTRLDLPVIGMESEFNVWLDEVEINPEPYWVHPRSFIDAPLLAREKTSVQLPTGGAVYFDRGVIEVVTPVIELAPHCTARMVRNLWEQIGFVREHLTRWGKIHGHTVRLKAYSSHYNISYEMPRSQQTRDRNEKKLALLLAYLLPAPVMVVASNRRSTGVGVRPRGSRIEITVDFTPDPGLMLAAATLIVGIVREVMTWPSYDLSMLEKLEIPVIGGVIPGKHTTRKGWLTKDFHYQQSPYTSDIDEPLWKTQFGDVKSLRQIARESAWFFRRSIRRFSDPFSFRLLFAILEGRAPSLLELLDRPAAYEDVGRLCKWGSVIHELKNYDAELELMRSRRETWSAPPPVDEFVVERQKARNRHVEEMDTVNAVEVGEQSLLEKAGKRDNSLMPAARPLMAPKASRRKNDVQGRLLPARPSQYVDRRDAAIDARSVRERRQKERRKTSYSVPFPDRRLSRSSYEQVFLKLVSGGRLRVEGETYTPVGMKGWYHAVFRRDSDGAERLMTIDQLLRKMSDWV